MRVLAIDTSRDEPVAGLVESFVDALQPYELEGHSSAILVAGCRREGGFREHLAVPRD